MIQPRCFPGPEGCPAILHTPVATAELVQGPADQGLAEKTRINTGIETNGPEISNSESQSA